MLTLKCAVFMGLLITVIFICACSDSKNPVPTEITSGSLDTLPIIGLTDMNGVTTATGILGAYDLTIDPTEMTAELVGHRINSIGEGYIVGGISFFTVSPCFTCLRLTGLDFSGEYLVLKFLLDHPFAAGNTEEPPSAINRLDLDVFDIALLFKPTNTTAVNFNAIGVSGYVDVLAKPDGCTREFSAVIFDSATIPYTLVVDESGVSSHTYNRLGMGESVAFDVEFPVAQGGPKVFFEIFLTMAYGASATKSTRLEPKYFNPEFNRKAPWKVEVTPLGTWTADDSTTPTMVEVKVYDWQSGAPVYGDPANFADAPIDNIYASSNITRVSVEIMSMHSTPQTVTIPSSGTGSTTNPLIYNVPVKNTNLAPAGIYDGLVKVLDSRAPGSVPPSGTRDFLIDSPNGVTMNNYPMPEYATYQTFKAVVYECTTQNLLWDFNTCTSPTFICQGWECGGCSLQNSDGLSSGKFRFGCVAAGAESCTNIYPGYLITAADSVACNGMVDHGFNAVFNVVSPSITLPVSSDGTFAFTHCNTFPASATLTVYISENGCSGPWISLGTAPGSDGCHVDSQFDISGYSGSDVMFRIKYSSVNSESSMLGCSNAGVVIDH
ncbi:hypothetical protein KKB99_08515, partial [bacterium]|nr:hypothetical protein [bacterium]MBU1026034.1 hypothetical protein [bacterium]